MSNPVVPPAQTQRDWMTITLPSLGRFYGDAMPNGIISVAKFTTNVEAILAGKGMDAADKVASILRACTRLPDKFAYTVGDTTFEGLGGLLSSDRDAILLIVRVATLGSDCKFSWMCTNCLNTNRTAVNLNTDVRLVTPDDLEDKFADHPEWGTYGEEPFSVYLKDIDANVKARFIRDKDNAEIAGKVRRMQLDAPGNDSTAIVRRAMQIISVDKDPDWSGRNVDAKVKYVQRNFSYADNVRFDNFFERRETGEDTRVSVPCSKCSAVSDQNITFGLDFFRPTSL